MADMIGLDLAGQHLRNNRQIIHLCRTRAVAGIIYYHVLACTAI